MTKRSLDDHIKDIRKASAPSIVPDSLRFKAPPVAKEEKEYLPALNEIIPDKKVLDRLVQVVEYQHALGQEEKKIRDQRKPFTTEIKKTLEEYREAGNIRALCGELKVNYYVSERKSIKAEALTSALLKRGIAPAIIMAIVQESTVTSSTATLKITGAGESESDGDY